MEGGREPRCCRVSNGDVSSAKTPLFYYYYYLYISFFFNFSLRNGFLAVPVYKAAGRRAPPSQGPSRPPASSAARRYLGPEGLRGTGEEKQTGWVDFIRDPCTLPAGGLDRAGLDLGLCRGGLKPGTLRPQIWTSTHASLSPSFPLSPSLSPSLPLRPFLLLHPCLPLQLSPSPPSLSPSVPISPPLRLRPRSHGGGQPVWPCRATKGGFEMIQMSFSTSNRLFASSLP